MVPNRMPDPEDACQLRRLFVLAHLDTLDACRDATDVILVGVLVSRRTGLTDLSDSDVAQKIGVNATTVGRRLQTLEYVWMASVARHDGKPGLITGDASATARSRQRRCALAK